MISDHTLSSPLFVPDSLKFYVNRLSFSKNRVRLQALSSKVASSGSQVIVRLPSNTMINLASLTMTGKVRAYFPTAPTDATNGCALPTNWDFSFIETLSLIANGGIITQPFTNYKLLANILNDVYGSNDLDQKRSALQGSLPVPIAVRPAQAADQQGGWLPFSINNWISATQTMAPSYISTNLLGDLELRLTMTDNSVVQAGKVLDNAAAASQPAWEMDEINFYIETASIGNNLVDQAVAAKLAAGEPINVPFENVFSFSQTNPNATFNQRFSVSSQSVNKILVTTQRNTDLNAGSTNNKFNNGIPQVLKRHHCGMISSQFSVNNQYSPNYQIDSNVVNGYDPVAQTNTQNYQASNALVETRAAMDIPDYDYDCCDKLCSVPQMPGEFWGGVQIVPAADPTTNKTTYLNPPSLEIVQASPPGGGSEFIKNTNTYWEPIVHKYPLRNYLEDKFVVATSFDFDVADKDRLVSGINTLGSNAQMFYNSIGLGNTANTSHVFVLCTSMVQIYAGATLKIVQ